MTENTIPKPFFTQGRGIVSAVLVVLILSVLGFGLGIFDTKSSGLLEVRIDGFRTDRLGRTSALITVSNISRATDMYINQGWFGGGAMGTLPGSSTNILSWYPSGPTRLADYLHLNPGQDTKAIVELPSDGRTGRVAVAYVLPNIARHPFLKRVEDRWRRWRARAVKLYWVIGTQEIQCPRVLPDGTTEPPRLLSKPGAKP